MRSSRLIPCALALLAMAATGCKDDPSTPSTPELTVTLTVTPTTLEPGKTAEIRVVGENRSGSSYSYQSTPGCEGTALVTVGDAERPAADQRLCLAIVTTRKVAPGESVEGSWSWNGDVLTASGPQTLPPGTYEIRGALGGFFSEPQTVTVAK